MMTKQQTQVIAAKFVKNCELGQNAGVEACLLNTVGDRAFMAQLFAVRGFRDLLAAALPAEQHKVGCLAKEV